MATRRSGNAQPVYRMAVPADHLANIRRAVRILSLRVAPLGIQQGKFVFLVKCELSIDLHEMRQTLAPCRTEFDLVDLADPEMGRAVEQANLHGEWSGELE